VVGLATVAQIAGELITGAVTLLGGHNVYGAAALVRQIVEVEYLAWAFAEEHAEAAAWMRSTRKDRLSMWGPHQLRKRSGGRFNDADYWGHCDRGGHPTPEATALLPDHARHLPEAWWWFDLAHHGINAWGFACTAAGQLGWAEQVSGSDTAQALDNAAARWQEEDPLHDLIRLSSALQPLDQSEPG
jgi:hypothetical protein